jgi:hypothetical protein
MYVCSLAKAAAVWFIHTVRSSYPAQDLLVSWSCPGKQDFSVMLITCLDWLATEADKGVGCGCLDTCASR